MGSVLWRGNLRFGDVTIPVGLTAAVKRNDVSFRSLHRDCGLPVKQVRECPKHGALEAEDIVKGWEVAPGQFLTVEDADLDAIAPEQSRAIELHTFVRPRDVDAIMVDRSYWLKPAAEPIGQRPYKLLEQAMRRTSMAAIGSFTLWRKDNLCLVRVSERALLLQTLHYVSDLRPNREILDELAKAAAVDPRERELAEQLIHELAGPADLAAFESVHRRNVRELLERRLADGDAFVVAPADEEIPPPAANLVDALERSLKTAKKPRRRRSRATA